MLAKAILTGGVLSVLAGSIVYFGTEGADALEVDARETFRLEETDLAGGADVAVGNVEIEKASAKDAGYQDPPQEKTKPKTKWLDQYLKKTKPEVKPEPKSEPIVIESMTDPLDIDVAEESVDKSEKKTRVRVEKRIERGNGRGEAKGTYVVSEGSRIETLDIEDLDIDALTADGDVDVEALIEELGLDSEKNVQIRVVKKVTDKPTLRGSVVKSQREVDYSTVIAEAEKLLVIDMRNQAYLEIIDHAVDRGDMMQAADIVEELSTPELRDTARARIGTGLARRGDTKAAFAVLDELEIDELSAPIRLEIITALMATRQERKSFASQ